MESDFVIRLSFWLTTFLGEFFFFLASNFELGFLEFLVLRYFSFEIRNSE